MGFEGFSDRDFDAYLPARRTSAMHTLARRQVRDKLKALMGEVVATLGDEVAGMELCLSSDSPSLENNHSVSEQGAYLIRSSAERDAVKALVEKLSLRSSVALDVATFHKHASLGVVLDELGVCSLMVFHPRGQVDRQNLRAKLSQGWAQDALLAAFKALPDTFQVQLPGSAEPLVPSQITVEVVITAGKALETEEMFRVSHRHARADLNPSTLAATLVADLKAMAPLYHFGAWSKEQDHIQAVKAAKEQRQEAQRVTQLQVGDRVKILSGLWSGRSGTVEAVDKKGALKVQVGLVSVKVEAKDTQLLA